MQRSPSNPGGLLQNYEYDLQSFWFWEILVFFSRGRVTFLKSHVFMSIFR